MIQLTWRQFRVQAYIALAALIIAAAVMVVTGVRLAHLYNSILFTRCGEGCGGASDVLNNGGFFYLRKAMGVLVLVLPALTGMFWGAPLAARELETGTFRLAWTQSVTRRRWLAVKLAVLGSASVAVAGLFGLMASWWARPYNLTTQLIGGRFAPGQFEIQGIVPAGYAAFGFAAAVTAGVLIGRTLPAMAAGLAVFAGARLAVRDWVRPHLVAPVRLSLPLNYGGGGGFRGTAGGGFLPLPRGPPLPGAWVYSIRAVDKAGHTPTQQFLRRACPGNQGPGGLRGGGAPAPAGGQDNCAHNLAAKLHGLFIYQPAGRYWLFQACETAIFIALAALLALFCLWRIRRAGGTRWRVAFWGGDASMPAGARLTGRLVGHRPARPAGPTQQPRGAQDRSAPGRTGTSVIRLAWRQFRTHAYVALAVLVITAAAAVTRPGGPLGQAMAALVLAVPALIGLFWGAPLAARELETGTFRLAWTQSVTRRRWLAARLAVAGLAAITAAGLLGLIAGWWAGPQNLLGDGRFVPSQFAAQGIVPAGYAVFAFAAGATAGLLIRRTVPAMAATLAAFAAARYTIQRWVRPHYAAPLRLNVPLTYNQGPQITPTQGGLAISIHSPTPPNSWIYEIRAVDKTGHAPTLHFLQNACPSLLGHGHIPTVQKKIQQSGGVHGCISNLAAKLHGQMIYQPASRYWLFQAYETAIFAALAALLAWFCFCWIRRIT